MIAIDRTIGPSSLCPSATPAAATAPADRGSDLGAMPEWNLDDLYTAADSAEFKRDLAHGKSEAVRIKAACQGKLDRLPKAHMRRNHSTADEASVRHPSAPARARGARGSPSSLWT